MHLYTHDNTQFIKLTLIESSIIIGALTITSGHPFKSQHSAKFTTKYELEISNVNDKFGSPLNQQLREALDLKSPTNQDIALPIHNIDLAIIHACVICCIDEFRNNWTEFLSCSPSSAFKSGATLEDIIALEKQLKPETHSVKDNDINN